MSTFIRSFITVLMFSAFIVLWISAWRRGNSSQYDHASRLPLEDGADHPSALDSINSHSTTV